MEESDLLISCGITKPLATLTHRDIPQLIEAIALHSTVLAVKAELDQLILGLQDSGVLQCLQLYPDLFRPVFVYASKPSLSAGSYWTKVE